MDSYLKVSCACQGIHMWPETFGQQLCRSCKPWTSQQVFENRLATTTTAERHVAVGTVEVEYAETSNFPVTGFWCPYPRHGRGCRKGSWHVPRSLQVRCLHLQELA